MTRDSNGWYWIIAASILTAVGSKLVLVDALTPPAWREAVHAAIELTSMIVGILAGLARMSNYPLSPEGREKLIRAKSESLDQAAVAALDASIKVDKAVDATSKAAAATEQAKDLSEKAGDK